MDGLGIESGNIQDSQLVSKTSLDDDTDATHGRLNLPDDAWTSGIDDEDQWIEVRLLRQTTITGVLIQGNPTSDRWVTTFQIKYSLDHGSWSYLKDDAGANEVLFIYS